MLMRIYSPFCVDCQVILSWNTFKQHKLTQSALKLDTFVFQVSNKTQEQQSVSKYMKKLKGVSCGVHGLLRKVKITDSVFIKICSEFSKLMNSLYTLPL